MAITLGNGVILALTPNEAAVLSSLLGSHIIGPHEGHMKTLSNIWRVLQEADLEDVELNTEPRHLRMLPDA